MRQRKLILYVLPAGALLGVLIAIAPQLSQSRLIEQALAITEPTRFDQPPVFVGSRIVSDDDGALEPAAVTLHEGRLLVCYLNSDRIDEFSDMLDHLRTLRLLDGNPASLTGVTADSTRLYAADALSGELLISDYHTGKLIQSIGFLPDNRGRMNLTNVTYAAGNLYATDAATRQVLVISSSAVPGVRDEWELMLHFPTPGVREWGLQYPTGATVTPDGRLLVSDAGNRSVIAFTCNGRFAHMFEKGDEAGLMSPIGLALDDLPSPVLLALADTVFHPSGVYRQGRIHIVDATLARVKVFDTLGSYVLTYGAELRRPRGIAIDQTRRLILVADAELHAIMVYRY